MLGYFLLVVFWVCWCALHSALVSTAATEYLRNRFPQGFRYHRIVYNVIAVGMRFPQCIESFCREPAEDQPDA